jgi:hypothetical protein
MSLDDAIQGKSYVIDNVSYTLFEICGIDETDIGDAYVKQASRLAYFGSLVANARALHEEAKNNRERIYAEADTEIRSEYKDNGIKFTEASLKAEVLLDQDYRDAQEAEISAKRDLDVLSAIMNGIRSRGDMLIQLGAELRHERQFTDMQVKEALRERG